MSDTFTFSSWGSSWPGSPGNMFDVFFSRWAGITNVGSCPAQGTVPDPLGLTANPLFQVKTGSKETSSPHWAEPLQSPFQKDPAPWIYLCFAISRDTHRSSLSQCLPQIHRIRAMEWFGLGGTEKNILFPPPARAGTPSTSPGCSGLHPSSLEQSQGWRIHSFSVPPVHGICCFEGSGLSTGFL